MRPERVLSDPRQRRPATGSSLPGGAPLCATTVESQTMGGKSGQGQRAGHPPPARLPLPA